MEALPWQPLVCRSWWLAAVALAAAVGAASGCVTTASYLPGIPVKETTAACQVVAMWQNQVNFAPDPVHGGAPTPGLAGRVYLFGPEIGHPVQGDGALVVDLYTILPEKPDAGLVHLEQWRIDKDTLKRLQKRDFVGWGYTVFLPWGTYRPDISQVQLRVRFEPVKGTPLYVESKVTLNSGPEATPVVRQRVETGAPSVKGARPVGDPVQPAVAWEPVGRVK